MKSKYLAILCLCSFALALAPRDVWAQAAKAPPPISASLKGEARTAYRLGVVLYDEGDWAGALTQFERAYQISNDARLLWNMAVCEKNRRRYTRALALVDTYLNQRTTKLQARERSDAVAFRDTVEKLTRLVVLPIEDAGATVTLDGELVGTTPIPQQVRLDVGDHEVLIQKPGFVDHKFVFSTEKQLTPIKLVPDEGRLVVKASPKSAAITINGEPVGYGNYDGNRVPGPAFLKISADGMRTYQDEILVKRGEVRTVDVTLEPASSRRIWAWVGAGAVALGAAAVAGYFIANPTIERPPIQEGSWATVRLGN